MGDPNVPPQPPFIADERGFATEDSVREALSVCGLSALAELDAEYHDIRGALVLLIANNCPAKHLGEGWPDQFKKIAVLSVMKAQGS